jgi:hypothetical protein
MIRSSHAVRHSDTGQTVRSPAAVLWAGGGFVAGIAFWHAIGFWSLVNTAVFGSDTVAASRTASPAFQEPAAPSRLETGTLREQRTACVALALNRMQGETRAMPCFAMAHQHADGGTGRKSDREAAAARSSGLAD